MSMLLSNSVVSDSLKIHGLQRTKLPCPSLSPGACSNSCPLSHHPTILSSAVPFSPCLQSFPDSGSFPVSQFFTSSGQSTEASAWASVLPMNIQGWFALGLTGLISLLSKGLSRIFFSTTIWNISSLVLSLLYGPTFTSIHMTTTWLLENHSFDYM